MRAIETSSLHPAPRLRLPEAATYLGIALRSLADPRWRTKHSIPCVKIGKAIIFDRVALDRWVEKHTVRYPRDFSEAVGNGGA